MRNWGYLLALGILFIILGTIGLGMLIQITLVSMLVFAILLFIAGFCQIVDVFKAKNWHAVIWHACIAVLYIIGGCIMFYDPIFASTIITAMLAWVFILIGLTRLIMVFTLRESTGYSLLLISGILAIILGSMILIQWPISGLWVIGLFITIELIITGWSYIFMAVALRTFLR